MSLTATNFDPAGRSSEPSRASRLGLDWFVFFLADVQTGFGPFVSVYLTAENWPQADIGLVLTIGALTALLGQIPGGAIVDAARSTRWTAALAVGAVAVSAFALAAWPVFTIVIVSRLVQAGASCVLGPAIAAISLGLVGHDKISERLGRNGAFASAGSGFAAASMGAFGFYLSSRWVFLVAAAMALPALIALYQVRSREIDPHRAHGGVAKPDQRTGIAGLRTLITNRPLLTFALCVVLFQLANAAMLPLAAGIMTLRSARSATILVAISIVAPQLLVTFLSPWVGRTAHRWGRKPLLVLCFGALTVRAALFAIVTDPHLIVSVQLLDGISAAVLGVLVPLTVADVSRGTGHFNLGQGVIGCAVGIGASISTTLAGFVSDRFGASTAFAMMASIAAIGFATVWFKMPETRPPANC